MGPDHFTVLNMAVRLGALDQDPWQNFHAVAVPLTAKR